MVQSSTIVLLGASAGLVYVIQLVIEFRRKLKSIENTPGLRLFLHPREPIGNISPVEIPWICLANDCSWMRKYSDFARFGQDIISAISLVPRGRTAFYVADPAVVKEVTSSRARFPKPTEQYQVITKYGQNIVSTEGEEWKKHRKIANPAFSESNYRLVWQEATRITLDMINDDWKDKEEIVIDDASEITLYLALMVIGSAGFGRKISLKDDQKIPPGHQMTFTNALHTVSTGILVSFLVPDWASWVTPHFRRVTSAAKEMKSYMQEMIDSRRAEEKKPDRYDLFALLLDANADEESGPETKLSDSELIGNIYIFLLAGHETTAHTLCLALGLLALYPDEQEIVHQKIQVLLPDGRLPAYDDMNSLFFVTAVFYETLRLFPPVGTIPKKSAEDTILATTNNRGERVIVPIPKDSEIVIYASGLHHNPKYWKDPEQFRPRRFLENWPRDAFLPFSSGSRQCLGRKFSETEATAILTLLITKYRIEVKEEPQYANETFEQRKSRVLAGGIGSTWTPKRVPLVFKRR